MELVNRLFDVKLDEIVIVINNFIIGLLLPE